MKDEAMNLAQARPGQVDPGWIAFWKSNAALPADAAVWTDPATPALESWYLGPDLATLAQPTALAVKKVGSKQGDYAPPAHLTARAHAVVTATNPGFLPGLTKYFSITNAAGALVAIVAQSQDAKSWSEHWWLDQTWVDLAPSTGTTVTPALALERTAATRSKKLAGVTYKKHTFTP